MATVLAVDLGGTKTATARVNERGELTDRCVLPAKQALDDSVAQIVGACRNVDAVGIIVPGIYTPSTGRAWCPNLWGLDEVPLLAALTDRLSVRVFVDSDRAGYVLGESWLGAARGLRDVVFVSIGTGIGVGILSGGSIVGGAHGIAGAAGWFALNPEWREEYGATGCWEAEAAGPAVARAAGTADAREAVTAARRGDELAIRAIDRAILFSAMGIANLISVLNPEAVVVGGGLIAGGGDLMLERIRAEMRRWAQPIAAQRCRIELTQLGETAGLFGAARLALNGL